MDPQLDDFGLDELAREFLDGPAVDPQCDALDLPFGTFETSLNSSTGESWAPWIEGIPKAMVRLQLPKCVRRPCPHQQSIQDQVANPKLERETTAWHPLAL